MAAGGKDPELLARLTRDADAVARAYATAVAWGLAEPEEPFALCRRNGQVQELDDCTWRTIGIPQVDVDRVTL